MLTKSETALTSKTRTPLTLAAIKVTLLVGTIFTGTNCALANEETRKDLLLLDVQPLGEMADNTISVQSSQGMAWDTVLDGELKLAVSGQAKTGSMGNITFAGLFPGHCLAVDCGTHPAIWTVEPNQPLGRFKVGIGLQSGDLVTAKDGENLSPASWIGEQVIAECNASLAEESSTSSHTLNVNIPFTFVMVSEGAGIVSRTSGADFLVNCMAFDANLADLGTDDAIDLASLGENGGMSGGGSSNGDFRIPSPRPRPRPIPEGDIIVIPPADMPVLPGEGGIIDLGELFPFPLPIPPLDPEIPEPADPEEPVDPEVNPGLGELPDDLVSPDGGNDPDPGPDPDPGIIIVKPPVFPIDPKVNPGIGKLPTDLTAGNNPTHSGKVKKPKLVKKPKIKIAKPPKRVTNPKVTIKKPPKRVTNPKVTIRKPAKKVTKPKVAIRKPAKKVTNPKVSIRKPSKKVTQPKVIVRKPAKKITRPKTIVRKPAKRVTSPKVTVRKPAKRVTNPKVSRKTTIKVAPAPLKKRTLKPRVTFKKLRIEG